MAAGNLLSIGKDAVLGGACEDMHMVRVRRWLLRYLSDAEQGALSRLWLFRGGFGLEAASAMLGTQAPTPVLQLLRDLENASCLQAARSPADASGSTRYRVHALVGEIFQGQFGQLSGPLQQAVLQSCGDVMIGHADQLVTLLSGERWQDATELLADEITNFQQLCMLLDDPQLASWARSERRLRSLNNLGCCECNLGYSASAVQLHRRVWEIWQQVLGVGHPATLSSMSNLANALQDMGQHAEAARLYRDVLEMKGQVLGGNHPDVLSSMSNLAITLQGMGQHAEAAQLHWKVLEMRQRVLENMYPDILSSMSSLALALQGMGQHEEAVEVHQEVLAMRQQVLKHNHPDTLGTMSNLAMALRAMGQPAEAAKLNRRVLKTRRQVLGPKHPDTLTSLSNLANALQDMGQYIEAGNMYKTVLEVMQQVLGDKHPNTLSSLNNLAATHCYTWGSMQRRLSCTKKDWR